MPVTIPRRRGRLTVLAATFALLVGAVPGPVAAGNASPPAECAPIMPKGQVEEGMVGRGWTVARDATPQPFRVEVLGILPDGIAPGKDLIVVEVSDVAGSTIIDDAGGIWAGMSGSPVYVNGQLIGAVAYSLSGSTSPVGGVTPATDMRKVLDYGPQADPSANDATRVQLPSDLQRVVAARAGVSEARARELGRMPVPLVVSGLSSRTQRWFQERIDEMDIDAVVVRGSKAARPTAAGGSSRPVPGGNFAGVISYGDITLGGIGTTTFVCGDRALAFGHPLAWLGRTTYGANDADAISIIADPVYGSYKLATIEELFGIVDQDRLSALRADLGAGPDLTPVRSSVRDLSSGNERDGASHVAVDDFVPLVAANQLFANMDPTSDRVTGGSSVVTWAVTGRRENGSSWSLERTNRYADPSDISYASVDEMYFQLEEIAGNRFEDVTFESIDISATVRRQVRLYEIEEIAVSRNGGPFRVRDFLRVSPGDELTFRVRLRQYRGGVDTETLTMQVPDTARGDGYLSIYGGASSFDECFWDPAACSSGNGFNAFLRSLENAPKNNELLVDFEFRTGSGRGTRHVSESLDRVIYGGTDIYVSIGR